MYIFIKAKYTIDLFEYPPRVALYPAESKVPIPAESISKSYPPNKLYGIKQHLPV